MAAWGTGDDTDCGLLSDSDGAWEVGIRAFAGWRAAGTRAIGPTQSRTRRYAAIRPRNIHDLFRPGPQPLIGPAKVPVFPDPGVVSLVATVALFVVESLAATGFLTAGAALDTDINVRADVGRSFSLLTGRDKTWEELGTEVFAANVDLSRG